MSLRLYDLPTAADEIESELVRNFGELTPELEETFRTFLVEGTDKVEAAAVIVRSLEAQAEICRSEAKRLSERSAGLQQGADRLKGLMLYAVDGAFGGKVKTALFTIWGQNSAPVTSFELKPGADIYQIAASAPQFIRARDPELDKLALKDAYKGGQGVPEGIAVTELPGSRSLRIK